MEGAQDIPFCGLNNIPMPGDFETYLVADSVSETDLFYGSPIPLVDSTMVPVKGLIVPIEQKLQKILSKHHYIEPNR